MARISKGEVNRIVEEAEASRILFRTERANTSNWIQAYTKCGRPVEIEVMPDGAVEVHWPKDIFAAMIAKIADIRNSVSPDALLRLQSEVKSIPSFNSLAAVEMVSNTSIHDL